MIKKEYSVKITVQDILNELEDGVSYIIYVDDHEKNILSLFVNSEIMMHCYHKRNNGKCSQKEFDKLMRKRVRTKRYVEVITEPNQLQGLIEMHVILM